MLRVATERVDICRQDCHAGSKPETRNRHTKGVHPGFTAVHKYQFQVRAIICNDQSGNARTGSDVDHPARDALEGRHELSGVLDDLGDGSVTKCAKTLRCGKDVGD